MRVQAIAGLQTESWGLRRGACPTLGRPMPTGDGFLARLRPEDCRLTLSQLRALALAAAEHGNGILEVTARGSLQIRGLRPETVAPFERAVLAAGIVPASDVMVEVPPLAGIDPDELIDPRPLAEEIRQVVAAHEPALMLAPKLAIIVDGGGRFHLGDVTADVRLTAIDEERLLLALGGSNRTARRVAAVRRKDAARAVLKVLTTIASLGPAARGKDVEPSVLAELYDPAAGEVDVRYDVQSYLGLQQLGGEGTVTTLGLALPYRQAHAKDLIAFLDDIEILGLSDIRLSPAHGLIFYGMHAIEAAKAGRAARRHGFWTSSDELRSRIALCAGAMGCASAHFDTRATAEEVARRIPSLLDGSITLHLSGCPKGCAHPAASALTLTGTPSGYALVVNGAAPDPAALYIAAKDLGTALDRLASLAAGAKETGETIRDTLDRLGPARIAIALKLDGQ